MTAQGRVTLSMLVSGLLWVLAVGAAWGDGTTPSAPPPFDPMRGPAMREDARLTDVYFVTPELGWAVGDRGTIWHTNNGGHQWRLQESGTGCRLESVFFLDDRHGWAAGGSSHPYTHTSSGVILATSDGGEHWNSNARVFVPALKKIRFFDARRGWAIGCASAMFPSGVFVTDNGGRSWNPLAGTKCPGWQAGDLLESQAGAVAGPRGAVASVERANLAPAQMPPFGLCSATRLELILPGYGMLVGQGGLILLTGDAGATWQPPSGVLPVGAPGGFDFRALAVRGTKCWIAGAPGTRVFHTPDAGRTWYAAPTGQSLPLESLTFVDDQHGWAVGQLGTILATDDGGQTWNRQRAGGARAALLGLLSGPDDVPLELLARISGDEGYLSVVELITRSDLECPPRTEVEIVDRVHDAVVGVGACGASIAWRFPRRPSVLRLTASAIAAGWDRVNGGHGKEELEIYLVRQIRTWRPDVLVTNDLDSQGDDPTGGLIAQAVLQAVALAAEPTAYSDQIQEVGLAPWQVKKVYTVLKPGAHAATDLPVSQIASRLGRALADVAAGPRGFLEDRCRAVPESIGFHLVFDQASGPSEGSDFFRGTTLEPGGEARRRLGDALPETVDRFQRTAQKQRNLRAVLERSQTGQGTEVLLAQAGNLIQDLDPESASQILFRLAQRYVDSGQWPLAAETYQLLVQRYPGHPLARPAQVWLLQYYASGEAAWRINGAQRITGVRSSALALKPSAQENRPERAAALGQEIQRTRPELYAEPIIGFPLAVAERARGDSRRAERFYQLQARSGNDDPWSSCARGEQWLTERRGASPKPTVACVAAPAKPHLDGQLDDEVWKQAKRAELRSPSSEEDWPATVMLAYDDQFLYLGLECRRTPGAVYEPTEGPRPRDADLAARDRIDLFLDLDRDYVSYYRLTLDYRGWTAESCWGDATWDPNWFVAAAAQEGSWTAEAAIPLDQLTGTFPQANTVWVIGLQRTIPRVGFQSWNTPASPEVAPEGFGYLEFQ